MRDLVIGIVVGLAVGALIVYGVMSSSIQSPSEVCETNTVDINKSLNDVTDKLNTLIHANYPSVNVRITNTEPYGEIYLLNLQFYDENGTIANEQMFMTADGSMLLMNNQQCVIQLTQQNEEKPVEKVNVSADDDPYTGAENAKVVIIEFSDYTCPYCAKFANEVEPKLLENYGDKVKFVFRDFPVHGEIAYKGAEAADCAGEQGKYWEFHRILYEKQREWMSNTSMLYTYAKQLGLNVTAFKACLDSGKYKTEVDKDLQDGISYGVKGTPTFFINGKKIVGYMPYEEFAKLIDKELNKQ